MRILLECPKGDFKAEMDSETLIPHSCPGCGSDLLHTTYPEGRGGVAGAGGAEPPASRLGRSQAVIPAEEKHRKKQAYEKPAIARLDTPPEGTKRKHS